MTDVRTMSSLQGNMVTVQLACEWGAVVVSPIKEEFLLLLVYSPGEREMDGKMSSMFKLDDQGTIPAKSKKAVPRTLVPVTL